MIFPKKNTESERGNALVYVLIAVALFAALTMTLTRQNDTSEAGTLSDDRAELYATQLIGYAAQAKSVVDQMMFTGTSIDEMDFTLPTAAGFNTAPHIHKIYHPEGGGLSRAELPEGVKAQNTSGVVSANWYVGRFNNIDWSKSANEDIILAAYDINDQVCGKINAKVNGSETIPTTAVAPHLLFIDDSYYTGSNGDITTAKCPDCQNMTSFCVQSSLADKAAVYYTILADQ